MTKILMLGMILFGISCVYGFPFRTSCGQIIHVNQTIANNMTDHQLAVYLGDINSESCLNAGTVPVHIYHH